MEENQLTPTDLEVLESKRLVDSFLKVDQDLIRHRKLNGHLSRPLDRLVISKPHSIGVLLYHKDRNSLILVEQYRYAAREDNKGWSIEIVAGNIDEGESVEECAVREVEEETGYRPEILVPIGQGYSSPGICNEKLYLFYSEVTDLMLQNAGGGLEEEGEDIGVVEWSVEQAWKMLEGRHFMDLKTQMAVQWFFIHKANRSPIMAMEPE